MKCKICGYYGDLYDDGICNRLGCERIRSRRQQEELAKDIKKSIEALEKRALRAERALKRAGFEDKGGQEWKPPINKDSFAPKYFAIEAENEKLWEFIKSIKEYINKAIPFYASGSEVDEKALYELERLKGLIMSCEPGES